MKVDISDDSIDEHLKALVSKTILDALTPEKRDALMSDAIKNLLQSDNAYHSLEGVFGRAVHEQAYALAKEHLERSDVKARVNELVKMATEKALAMTGGYGDDKDENVLISRIADAIQKAIVGDKY